MYGKSNMETYITICKIDSQRGICCMAQALYQPRGVEQGGRWAERFKREGVYVHLWLIHAEV